MVRSARPRVTEAASIQESQCENGKSRTRRPRPPTDPPPPRGSRLIRPYVRPTVATIDLTAGKGRAGLAVGGKRAHRGKWPVCRRDRRHREARHRGRHPLGHRPHRGRQDPPGPDHRPRAGPERRSDTPRTGDAADAPASASPAGPPRSAPRPATTSCARSASAPAAGKRYDGPCTWTAAITSPDASAIGAATDEIPASNSSIAHA